LHVLASRSILFSEVVEIMFGAVRLLIRSHGTRIMKAGGTSRQDAFAQLKGGSGDRRCQRKGRT